MDKVMFETMMMGIIATAVEKIFVLGPDVSKLETKKLRDALEEMDMFWNSDNSVSGRDWTKKFDDETKRAREFGNFEEVR